MHKSIIQITKSKSIMGHNNFRRTLPVLSCFKRFTLFALYNFCLLCKIKKKLALFSPNLTLASTATSTQPLTMQIKNCCGYLRVMHIVRVTYNAKSICSAKASQDSEQLPVSNVLLTVFASLSRGISAYKSIIDSKLMLCLYIASFDVVRLGTIRTHEMNEKLT